MTDEQKKRLVEIKDRESKLDTKFFGLLKEYKLDQCKIIFYGSDKNNSIKYSIVVSMLPIEDLEFIACCREDIPWLIDRIEKLAAALELCKNQRNSRMSHSDGMMMQRNAYDQQIQKILEA